MEADFRTTFIPKKPMIPQSAPSQAPVSRPAGILFVISVIIFIVSLGIAGAVYGYKTYLNNEVADLAVQLDRVQKTLDPSTIKEFTIMDKRLRNSEMLLNQHYVMYPLFEVLRTTTLPTVRYTKLDLAYNEGGDLVATLSGESDGYRSIALQSQALAQNADLKNTIFSNFVVTPKGRVSFDVSFSIPKGDLSFEKNINGLNGATIPEAATSTADTDTSIVNQLQVQNDAMDSAINEATTDAPVVQTTTPSKSTSTSR